MEVHVSLPNAGLELWQSGGLDGDVCAPAGPDTPKGGHAPLREKGAEPRHPVRLQAGPVAHTHTEFLAKRLGRVLNKTKIFSYFQVMISKKRLRRFY